MYFEWDGDVMVPLARFKHRCNDELVIGQQYRMSIEDDASRQSKGHYHAVIREAWKNLPEDIAEHFPTSDHLRKWCLIKVGYCDQRSIVCRSDHEAAQFAAFIRPLDTYAIVTISGPIVCLYRAKSQRHQDRQEFQKIKTEIFDLLASMIKVEPKQLVSEAARNEHGQGSPLADRYP